jgi:hypothetical protein
MARPAHLVGSPIEFYAISLLDRLAASVHRRVVLSNITVMRGLVPPIRVCVRRQDVDGHGKPGHDEFERDQVRFRLRTR